MWNPFKKKKPYRVYPDPGAAKAAGLLDPETDPIYVTQSQDPSLDEDEMIIHTFIDPNSLSKENKK